MTPPGERGLNGGLGFGALDEKGAPGETGYLDDRGRGVTIGRGETALCSLGVRMLSSSMAAVTHSGGGPAEGGGL